MTKLEEIIEQHANGINRTPEEFLKAVRESSLAYDDSGNLCNMVGGKLIPATSQDGALSIVYHRIKEEVRSAGRVDSASYAHEKTTRTDRYTLRYIGRFLNRIPQNERTKEVPEVDDLFSIDKVIQEAKIEARIDIDTDGKTYDINGGQHREISVEEYKQKLVKLYTTTSPTEVIPDKDIVSGTANVPASDGGPTRIMEKVIVAKVPTLMERLVQELKCAPDLAQVALADGNIRFEPEEDKFYLIQADGNIPLGLEDAVKAGRDYFASLAAPTRVEAEETVLPAVEERVSAVAQEVAPVAQEPTAPADLETVLGDEELIIDDDVVVDDPLDEKLTPEERENYIGPLARAHGKPLERIETVFTVKGIRASKDGKFYRHLPERDGDLKGEEVQITDVNNMLGDYFAAERLPIIVEEQKGTADTLAVPPTPVEKKAAEPDSSRTTIPEMKVVLPPLENRMVNSPLGVEEKFYQNGDAPHVPDHGLEQALAEAVPVSSPEDITKRPRWTYVVGGIGVVALTGLTLWMTYDSGKTVGESGKTVIQNIGGAAALMDDLNAQISDLEAELDTVRADNFTFFENKNIAEANYGSCQREVGETKTTLKQKNVAYAALEQQLIVAQAEKDETAADLEDCSIASSTPTIEYVDRIVEKVVEKEVPVVQYVDKVIEKEIPIEVEKIVEKEVVKYVNKECPPVVECPQVAPECPATDTELTANFSACMKEKYAIVKNIEEADNIYAVCEADKEIVQSAYDNCVGELGTARAIISNTSDLRYLAIKKILENSKSTKNKGDALVNLVENYVKEAGNVVSISANGVCETALSNLYHAITSVKDNDVKHNFTLMLTEAGICVDFTPGSKYLNLEIVDE
jgi:hypothetical protein